MEPGSYVLTAQSWDATSETRYWARLPVTVGETAPARAVLPLQPLPALTGKVETRSSEAPPRPQAAQQEPGTGTDRKETMNAQSPAVITLTPVPRADHLSDQQATVNARDGSFRLPGLAPGRWRIHYYSGRQPAWIESAQFGASTVENGEIEIMPGSTPLLRLRLSSDFARPRLELKLPPNAARIYWVVYAVPVQSVRLDSPVVAAVGYPDSLKVVSSLPPDQYVFFAVPRTIGGGTFNERFAELMSHRLTPAEISTGSETTVEVRCFLPGEVDRAIASYIAGDGR
ncbi:MAG: hypothetical protein QM757_04835 [Paludibaculum sp.]